MLLPRLFLLLCLFLLVACGPGEVFEDSSGRATREADEAQIQETINFVETQAATIDALQAIANNAGVMGTQVAQLNSQNQSLQATINSFASGSFAQNSVPQPPAADPSGALPSAATGGTPAPSVNQSQADTSGTRYPQVTTASAVRNADGCAEANVSEFQPTEDEIYIVVVAQDVTAGTTFSSRWTDPSGTRFDSVSWTPDTDFDDICIWFFITPDDLNFAAGNWTAQFLANGSPVANTRFSIIGEPTPAANSGYGDTSGYGDDTTQ